MLVNLPFPNIDFTSPDVVNLINRITHLLRNEVKHSNEKNISKTNDLYIERVIAQFFKLNQTDYELIFESLHSSEQLIPIKRLLNCNAKEIFSEYGI